MSNLLFRRMLSCILAVVIMLTMVSFTQLVSACTATNAEQVADAFIDTYWDAEKKYFYCNSDRQINPAHNPGPQNGLYTDYWWEAQLWETVMDIYERTGSSTYRAMIDDVYDGFVAAYPDWSTNPFNDDIGWWALAALRAYDITAEARYLNVAKQMFDYVYENQYSSDYGGGIWWNSINFLTQKNVATNATAAIIAIKLSRELGEDTYLEKAQILFNWVRDTFYDEETGFVGDHISGDGDGTVSTWEYTYNFGQYAAIAYEFYHETGNPQYLTEAYKAIDWVLDKMTNDGILVYEGEDDCPAFKMIFSRTVAQIGYGENKSEYIQFLQRNATQAYNHRRSDGLIGPDFSTIPDSSAIQVIAAAAGVSIMHIVEPDNYVGNIVSGSLFEAENARRYGIDNEKENSGFSGRGYTAGWNTQGTSIVFEYNAPVSGEYILTFRYAAAAGNANRSILLNGTVVNSALEFGGTSSWSTWNERSIAVAMTEGQNLIEIAMSASNANYLNLDCVSIKHADMVCLEAEEGLLTGVSTESTHEGYTGSGYIAGWNEPNTGVEIDYYASAEGQYKLSLHYAAATGNASRSIIVNGVQIQNETLFPSTGAWDSWSQVEVTIPLIAGSNNIQILQEQGNSNYLNLDSMSFELLDAVVIEAESGTLHNLSSESSYSGYTGDGYVAGWNSDGQSVELVVQMAEDGIYDLVFRYAVGNGDAVRKLCINNDIVVPALTFSGGNDWGSYYTVEVQNVLLVEGENTISLIFDSTSGSNNWLNLDCLIIS